MGDPTDLKSVLSALNKTTKGKLRYPYNEPKKDDAKDICVLKYIDDLNNIPFSPGFSFGPEVKSNSETEDDDEDSITSSSDNKDSISPIEEFRESNIEKETKIEDWNLSSLVQQFRSNASQRLKMELEEEFELTLQISCTKKNKAYIETVNTIRDAYKLKLEEDLRNERLAREANERTIEQLKQQLKQQISNQEQDYERKIDERQKCIMDNVEAANLRDQQLLNELRNLHNDYTTRYSNLIQNMSTLKEPVKLDPPIEQSLNETIEQSRIILDKSEQYLLEEEITNGITSLKYSLDLLTSVEELIESRKDIEKKTEIQETEKLKQQEAEAIAALAEAAKVEDEKTKQTAQENTVTITSVTENQPTPPQELPPHLVEAENKYKEMQSKLNKIQEESKDVKKDKNLGLPLAKAVGLVNQLNNDSRDSNRDKLQQIMNLLSGKTCTIGEQSLSIQNNSAALAFVKDQLSSKVVNLGHDKQVTSMYIYAALTVRLWQFFPEAGELILLRLYEVCPYLIPRKIECLPDQTSEQYNRSQGYRHKDGGTCEALDKFLTRMGAAAQFYAYIVCMDIENQPHPHGIHDGWKWIASFLSIPPHKVGSAAVLQGFLTVAGNAFIKFYGKQFKKILMHIASNYIPALEKETIEGGYSDIATLKKLIETFVAAGNIPPPSEGYKCIM